MDALPLGPARQVPGAGAIRPAGDRGGSQQRGKAFEEALRGRPTAPAAAAADGGENAVAPVLQSQQPAGRTMDGAAGSRIDVVV